MTKDDVVCIDGQESFEGFVSDYVTITKQKKTSELKLKKLKPPLVEFAEENDIKKQEVSNGSLSFSHVRKEGFDLVLLKEKHPELYKSCCGTTLVLPTWLDEVVVEKITEMVKDLTEGQVLISELFEEDALKKKLENEEVLLDDLDDSFGVLSEYWRLNVK